ncbi:hypothetical protein FRX31_011913 [Thalictrum thalictroides]|uniref:Uncharacterized protein n=1 Tax=Thalictrum thalictroides TaxID=46969 RepID=A0A7J6WMA3_THATH|nr:hypothetical protein FRX31_011913 [Thalictrum thalictroides]
MPKRKLMGATETIMILEEGLKEETAKGNLILQRLIEETQNLKLTKVVTKYIQEGPKAMNSISREDMIALEYFLDNKLKEIEERIRILKMTN